MRLRLAGKWGLQWLICLCLRSLEHIAHVVNDVGSADSMRRRPHVDFCAARHNQRRYPNETRVSRPSWPYVTSGSDCWPSVLKRLKSAIVAGVPSSKRTFTGSSFAGSWVAFQVAIKVLISEIIRPAAARRQVVFGYCRVPAVPLWRFA